MAVSLSNLIPCGAEPLHGRSTAATKTYTGGRTMHPPVYETIQEVRCGTPAIRPPSTMNSDPVE